MSLQNASLLLDRTGDASIRCRAFVSLTFVALSKCFHAFDDRQCLNDRDSLYNSYSMLCLLYSREKTAHGDLTKALESLK